MHVEKKRGKTGQEPERTVKHQPKQKAPQVQQVSVVRIAKNKCFVVHIAFLSLR